jgi:FAD/FMN-containing dehydrogenase
MGPGQSDFQRIVIGSQGSMGIMTWISLRTELLPSVERPMIVAGDELSKIIGYVYKVQRPWLGEQTFILNRTAAAMLMTFGNTTSFERVRNSIPEYLCLQNIAGFERFPGERLQYQYEELTEMAGDNGLALKESAGEVDAADLLKTSRRPCGREDWRHALKGHCLSVFFLSLLDKSETFITIARESAAECNIQQERIGIYLQPIVQNHACHLEFMVPYDPGAPEETAAMKKYEVHLTDRLMAAKAFFSRPYGRAAETVFANNPGNTELIRVIKSMFDPDNILNPGKFFI